ncbi:MAG: hypothetical protein Q9218_004854 [Villophora microphyllina]
MSRRPSSTRGDPPSTSRPTTTDVHDDSPPVRPPRGVIALPELGYGFIDSTNPAPRTDLPRNHLADIGMRPQNFELGLIHLSESLPWRFGPFPQVGEMVPGFLRELASYTLTYTVTIMHTNPQTTPRPNHQYYANQVFYQLPQGSWLVWDLFTGERLDVWNINFYTDLDVEQDAKGVGTIDVRRRFPRLWVEGGGGATSSGGSQQGGRGAGGDMGQHAVVVPRSTSVATTAGVPGQHPRGQIRCPPSPALPGTGQQQGGRGPQPPSCRVHAPQQSQSPSQHEPAIIPSIEGDDTFGIRTLGRQTSMPPSGPMAPPALGAQPPGQPPSRHGAPSAPSPLPTPQPLRTPVPPPISGALPQSQAPIAKVPSNASGARPPPMIMDNQPSAQQHPLSRPTPIVQQNSPQSDLQQGIPPNTNGSNKRKRGSEVEDNAGDRENRRIKLTKNKEPKSDDVQVLNSKPAAFQTPPERAAAEKKHRRREEDMVKFQALPFAERQRVRRMLARRKEEKEAAAEAARIQNGQQAPMPSRTPMAPVKTSRSQNLPSSSSNGSQQSSHDVRGGAMGGMRNANTPYTSGHPVPQTSSGPNRYSSSGQRSISHMASSGNAGGFESPYFASSPLGPPPMGVMTAREVEGLRNNEKTRVQGTGTGTASNSRSMSQSGKYYEVPPQAGSKRTRGDEVSSTRTGKRQKTGEHPYIAGPCQPSNALEHPARAPPRVDIARANDGGTGNGSRGPFPPKSQNGGINGYQTTNVLPPSDTQDIWQEQALPQSVDLELDYTPVAPGPYVRPAIGSTDDPIANALLNPETSAWLDGMPDFEAIRAWDPTDLELLNCQPSTSQLPALQPSSSQQFVPHSRATQQPASQPRQQIPTAPVYVTEYDEQGVLTPASMMRWLESERPKTETIAAELNDFNQPNPPTSSAAAPALFSSEYKGPRNETTDELCAVEGLGSHLSKKPRIEHIEDAPTLPPPRLSDADQKRSEIRKKIDQQKKVSGVRTYSHVSQGYSNRTSGVQKSEDQNGYLNTAAENRRAAASEIPKTPPPTDNTSSTPVLIDDSSDEGDQPGDDDGLLGDDLGIGNLKPVDVTALYGPTGTSPTAFQSGSENGSYIANGAEDELPINERIQKKWDEEMFAAAGLKAIGSDPVLAEATLNQQPPRNLSPFSQRVEDALADHSTEDNQYNFPYLFGSYEGDGNAGQLWEFIPDNGWELEGKFGEGKDPDLPSNFLSHGPEV